MTVNGGSILLFFNLRRQTSKGTSQHLIKVPRETGEKTRLRMGAEGPNKIHRNIELGLTGRVLCIQLRMYSWNILSNVL